MLILRLLLLLIRFLNKVKLKNICVYAAYLLNLHTFLREFRKKDSGPIAHPDSIGADFIGADFIGAVGPQ